MLTTLGRYVAYAGLGARARQGAETHQAWADRLRCLDPERSARHREQERRYWTLYRYLQRRREREGL